LVLERKEGRDSKVIVEPLIVLAKLEATDKKAREERSSLIMLKE
jgi:hypothetical protein